MDRLVSYRYAEVIGRALAAVPPFILSRIEHAHFLTGTDPVWAGLHDYDITADGRSYRSIGHVVYPYHQEHLPKTLRRTTVVLPTMDQLNSWVVLHELGHVLHEAVGFRHVAVPITDYAATNDREAFACAFEAWMSPGYWDHGALMRDDPATVALFDRLAAGEAA